MATNGTYIFDVTRECIGLKLFFVGMDLIILSFAFK